MSANNHSRDTRFLLGAFSLGHLCNDWPPSAIWILAPAIALSMDLSPAELGLLFTLHSLGASVAYLPAGMLTDHVSDRGRLLMLTFWWCGIGYVLASFATDFWVLALLLAVAGMGDAAWHPMATGVLVQHLPDRRGEALGVHAMGGTLAEVVGPLMAGFLLGFLDWRTTLQLSAAPTLLMGVAFIWIARHVPRSTSRGLDRTDFAHFIRVWMHPSGLLVIAMIAVYHMALMAMLSMSALFLQGDHGFSAWQAGLVFAGGLLLGSLLQPIVGRWSDTAGRKKTFIGGATLASVCAVTVSFADVETTIVAGIIAAMTLLVAVRSGVLAFAVEYAGRREGTTLGFVFVAMDGIGSLGAAAAGVVGEWDLRYCFVLAAGFSLLSALLACVVPFAARAGESEPGSAQRGRETPMKFE
jgi:FSR family fosmidomycin resistance protein-like MFS transporter